MHHYDLEREMLRQIFNKKEKPIETIQEIECGTCLEAWGRDDCPLNGCMFRQLREKEKRADRVAPEKEAFRASLPPSTIGEHCGGVDDAKDEIF